MRWLSNFNQKFGQRLVDNRWLFIVLLSAFAFIFESSEILLGLEEIDAQYYREVIFFGLVFPIVVGWLLTILLHVQKERNEALQLQKLVEDMMAVPSWTALLETITSIPRRIAPVAAAGLYLQSHESEKFSLASEWSLLHPNLRFSLPSFDPVHACGGGENHPNELHAFHNNLLEEASLRGYCLPLRHTESFLGFLHLYIPRKENLGAEQIRIFNRLAVSIASTLESATPEDPTSVRMAATRLERERIARLLHDTLGQSLSYLRSVLEQFNIDDIYSRLSSIQHDLDRMRDISDDAYEQIRQTLHSLQPQYEGNLSDTLHLIASKSAERAGFELQFRVRGSNRQMLPTDVQRKILLVIREAINNIEQHARAKMVNLSLLWDETHLVITLEDDGIGFDPNSISGFGHFGIQIMKQRINEIEGAMEIDSTPGQGSKITFRCPITIDHALFLE